MIWCRFFIICQLIRNTEADIQTVTYAYNYFGQRISKKNGLDEVRYLTDIT
ncbi:MAG: hypothetical protein E7309_04425 [Butyrivibrio sp.]|nr:hypothetical protein [Butyrivibrio sp.]